MSLNKQIIPKEVKKQETPESIKERRLNKIKPQPKSLKNMKKKIEMTKEANPSYGRVPKQ